MFTRMMGALTGGSPDAGGGPPPDEDPAAAASGVGAPPATPPVTRGGVRVDTVAAVRGALYHTPAAHAAAQDVVYLSAVASVERRSPGGWHLTVADGDAIGGEAPSSPSSSANSDSDDGGGGGGTQPALATRATWPLDAASLQLTASRDGSQLAWSDAAAAPAAAAPPSTSGRWAFDVDPADAAAAPTFVTLLARGLALHGDADVTITAEALLAEVSSARAPSGAPVAAAAASVEEMVRVEPAPSPSADGVAGGGGAPAAASALYPSVAAYVPATRNGGDAGEPAAATSESALASTLVDGHDDGQPGDEAAGDGGAGTGAEAEAAAGPLPPLLPPTPGERARAGGDLFKYDVPNKAFARVAVGVLATLALKAADDEDDDEDDDEEDVEGVGGGSGRGSGHADADSPTFALNLYKGDSGVPFFSQTLSREMNLQFSAGQRSLVWVLPAAEVVDAMPSAPVAEPLCLSFRISEVEAFVCFRDAYAEAEFESSSASDAWADLSAAERSYVVDSVRDDVEMAIDDDDDVDANDDRSLGDAGPGTAMDVDADEEENNLLAVASTIDRSFVARGSRMGVFHTSDDGQRQLALSTMLEFTKAGGPGGARTPFKPSSMMLHQADSSLLVLDEGDPTVVHRMDLERGEVVESWSGGGAAAGVAAAGGRATRSGRSYAPPGGGAAVAPPIAALQRSEKYAHLTGEAGFVGLNARSVLRMDPRDPAFVVQSKTYATSTRGNLTAMATTGAGHVAVASSTGDLRLFDGIGKRAKTLLPGLGDPITAVDVTADGRWLLATTATYLLLLDTRGGGGRGETKGAFEKSLGDRKPTPRQLRLHPADVVAEGMRDVSFTAARFNMGDGVERSIVTSTGPFVVTWNFRQVKAGRPRAYSIRRYEDKVVADDFAFNDDGKIVVALPNNVSLTAYHR